MKEKHNEKSNVSFYYLSNEWLEFIRPNVKESTYCNYKSNIDRHILPVLGHINIAELSTGDMDRFVRAKLSAGKLHEPGGLSPKSVNQLLSLIRLILNYGKDYGIQSINNPQIHYAKQITPRIQILTLSEQRSLVSALQQNLTQSRLGILITLYTGLRIGEICALQWGDIDFTENTLSVRRTVMRIQNTDPDSSAKTKLIIDRPKTETSIRTIPVPTFLMKVLKTFSRHSDHYLLTGTTKIQEPRCYYAFYKRYMKSLHLGQYNFHALRHTFATRCVEQGFDIKSLSEILGHSDVKVTLTRYVHPTMEMKREQMERLAQITPFSSSL